MKEDTVALIDSSGVDAQIVDTANKILNGTSVDETKDLVALFNWNMSRKNVSRLIKLNGLLDSVSDQMELRLTTKADQFSNSDLIDYMKAIQSAIDTSSKSLGSAEEPPMIVQNNTQINVNVNNSFDREARERILRAVQQTLALAKDTKANDSEDGDITVHYEDVIEEDETDGTNNKETT